MLPDRRDRVCDPVICGITAEIFFFGAENNIAPAYKSKKISSLGVAGRVRLTGEKITANRAPNADNRVETGEIAGRPRSDLIFVLAQPSAGMTQRSIAASQRCRDSIPRLWQFDGGSLARTARTIMRKNGAKAGLPGARVGIAEPASKFGTARSRIDTKIRV